MSYLISGTSTKGRVFDSPLLEMLQNDLFLNARGESFDGNIVALNFYNSLPFSEKCCIFQKQCQCDGKSYIYFICQIHGSFFFPFVFELG